MGLESNVGREFMNIMEVIKSNVVADLVSANSELNLTQEQLESIQRTVESTVDRTGDRAVDTLTRLVSKG